MRQLTCALLLFLSQVFLPLAGHAAEPGYPEWLEFKKEFAEEIGGPAGIYAIQDMIELNAGEMAHLSAGRPTICASRKGRRAPEDLQLSRVLE